MNFSKVCVFLDNGHGSNTPGKCSPDKRIHEYAYVREIVYKLNIQLQALGIKTFIVVPETIDISLSERVRRVNKKYSEMKKLGYTCFLISVHLNAAGGDGKWKTASGWSGWVAKVSSANSKKLAQCLYRQAERLKLKGNRCVPPTKYWEANFTIIAKSNCPAVLTENLFQDNKQEVDFLLSDVGKNAIVELHVEGIKDFIRQL